MRNRKKLTIIQMNDSHAYLEMHQELFWQSNIWFIDKPGASPHRCHDQTNQD